MTSTSLITLNAVLAAIAVYGIVRLLLHGIHSDRQARHARAADVVSLRSHERDELAA